VFGYSLERYFLLVPAFSHQSVLDLGGGVCLLAWPSLADDAASQLTRSSHAASTQLPRSLHAASTQLVTTAPVEDPPSVCFTLRTLTNVWYTLTTLTGTP
jgi:hypothetical protein